jgi:transposase InsO family protein
MIWVIATHVEVNLEGAAVDFCNKVFWYHGLPHKIISDRGPQFVSKFTKALYKLLGITGNPSTAYHPQTDGQTERVNQEIEQYLRIFINHRQNDWSKWLPLAEFAYNDNIHSSTGYSPFYLNLGFHSWKGAEVRKGV